jgi:hypothetical protein
MFHDDKLSRCKKRDKNIGKTKILMQNYQTAFCLIRDQQKQIRSQNFFPISYSFDQRLHAFLTLFGVEHRQSFFRRFDSRSLEIYPESL